MISSRWHCISNISKRENSNIGHITVNIIYGNSSNISSNISSNLSSDISSDIGSKITTNSNQSSSHLLWGLGAGG